MANDDIEAEFHLPGVEALRREEMWGMVHDDNFHTALVTGCAGSGKTTVSVYRLVRLNNQGHKVRLLTYQNMLVVFIKNLVVNNSEEAVDIDRQVPLDRISTFHDWFYNQRKMRFDIDNPPSRDEIRKAFQQKGFMPNMTAELLIDEGQDLPLWIYDVLPEYYSRVVVGADEAQQVKPNMPRDHVEQIRCLMNGATCQPHRPYPLGQNFRNTYETYRFARQFLPRAEYEEVWNPNIVNRLLAKNHHGRKPMVIPYSDTATRDTHMQKVLRNAVGSTVGILCPIGPGQERYSGEAVGGMHKLITSWGFPATAYHSDLPVPPTLKRFIVTTFISAKGLEFDIVVVPRMNFFRRPGPQATTKIREEMYVACTRARSRLYIYRDQRNPQYDPIADFDPDTYETLTTEASGA
jgi:superfamily I DNA/RNA helicase